MERQPESAHSGRRENTVTEPAPVLRITSPDGSERWMPESRDIVRYLEQTYAKAA
jgi:hypothetical protein